MEELKNGVIKSLYQAFDLPIYYEDTPKSGLEGCFTVEEVETVETPLLNRRWSRKTKFQISYFPKLSLNSWEDCRQKTDALYEILFLIGDTEKFIGSDMYMERGEFGIKFFVSYAYQVMYEEEKTYMERLEYNGGQVIGYEESE
ncbi:phage tail terminator family protein [Chakrabartyella piscis]|uniref:phage tail terminator family protein n=1 Tax=Chakrabartyella piscis TaxID=2918914 RepID=UPI00295838DE|nr:hypothetical protein [Chakrabartyella piscis]